MRPRCITSRRWHRCVTTARSWPLQQPGAHAAFEQAQAEAPLSGRTLMKALVALDHARTLPPAEALVR